MRTQKQTIAFGYARDLFGNPAARQERALLDAGCRGVFIEGRGHEKWATFLQAMRRGGVAIVQTAAALPHGTRGIGDALSALDGCGVPLHVLDTGKRTDHPIQRGEIILEAIDGQKRHKHEFNSKTAKAAAKKSWKGRKPQRAPAKEVLAMWRDHVNHPNTQELAVKLKKLGWSTRMMYVRFGGRFPELGLGRPRKSSKD